MGVTRSWLAAMGLAGAALASAASAQQPVAGEVDRSLVPYANRADSVTLPDGRLLHMVCMGQGSPTVVFTAGAGDWSLTWSKVQPVIARTTRACAWDRAGFGLSTPPLSPQTVDQTTADLLTGLKAGGISGPYIVVGHSLGGYESLLVADRLRANVVGMVLVDPSFPDQLAALGKAAPAQAVYMLKLPNPFMDQLKKCSAALKAGTLRHGGPDPDKCLNPIWPTNYPPELVAALNGNVVTAAPEAIAAAWDTMMFFGSPNLLVLDSKFAVNPNRNYGNMPLIVLTRTEFQPPLDYPEDARAEIPAEEAAWNKGHDELAALSTRGVNVRVPGSGHFIQAMKPQAVIDAIEQVVREARETEAKPGAR